MTTRVQTRGASTESVHTIPSMEVPASVPEIIANRVTRADQRSGPRLTAKQHHELIEVTAYYLAERRGFDPGHETEDWTAAENWVIDRSGLAVT